MHLSGRTVDVGALLFGVVLLLVGGYYLLTNTFGFDLPELNWDMIWPLAVIVLGASVVARAVQSRGGAGQP